MTLTFEFFLYSFHIYLINILSIFVKIFNLLNKRGYIKENINFNMNLKERGITVGDLLIILIIILTTTILVKSFNKDKKTSLNRINQEKVFYNKIYHQRFIKNNLSV